MQKLKSSFEESKLNSEKKHTQEVELLKKEHELEKQDVENIHNAKIKALVKDVHQQLAEKDKGYEESFNEALGKFFRIEYSFKIFLSLKVNNMLYVLLFIFILTFIFINNMKIIKTG